MKYLKIFESYSAEEYQKILRTIRDMVGKRNEDDIKVYINKHINSELEVFKTIQKYFNKLDRLYFQHNMMGMIIVDDGYAANYIRTQMSTLKRFKRSGENGYFNYYQEFSFLKNKKENRDNHPYYFINYVESNTKYCMDKLNEILPILDDKYSNLKILLRRFFKIINWIDENGPKIKDIVDNRYNNYNVSDVPQYDRNNERNIMMFDDIQKLYQGVNFENSVVEYTKVKKAINTIIKKIMLDVT